MELREEIKHIVDELPEKALADALHQMEKIKAAASEENYDLEKFFDQIVSKNDNLLKRLAQ